MKRTLPEDLMERRPEESARLILDVQLHALRRASRRLRRREGEEGEQLHDVRVAMRRLRTTLRAYERLLGGKRARRLRRKLGELMDTTGSARDSEVALGRLGSIPHPTGARAHAWLSARWQNERRRGYRDARRALKEDLRPIVRDLEALVAYFGAPVVTDGPAPCFAEPARAAIDERTRIWKQALAQARRSGTDADIHRARIATKHVRYLLEPLAQLQLPLTKIVDGLARLQDELGAAHDRYVFRRRVEEEARHAPGLLRLELAELVAT